MVCVNLEGAISASSIIGFKSYPVPKHLQDCFSYLGYKPSDFTEAEKAAKEVKAIPIYPELTDDMKYCVAEQLLAFWN